MGRCRITTACSQVSAGLEADLDNILLLLIAQAEEGNDVGHIVLFSLFEVSVQIGCIMICLMCMDVS